MKKILLLLIIITHTLFLNTVHSQQKRENPLVKRFIKLELILKDKYPPVKDKQFEITIFSNRKCGRCNHLLKLLRKKNIPFMVYDLKIKKNGDLMRKLCYKKAGKKNIGIMYPVVLINDNTYFKIRNINDFANKIEAKYISAKQLKKS